MSASAGIHHVTAICRDPADNVAFYTGNLGLRMVKKTVNFDDPSMLASLLRGRDRPTGYGADVLRVG